MGVWGRLGVLVVGGWGGGGGWSFPAVNADHMQLNWKETPHSQQTPHGQQRLTASKRLIGSKSANLINQQMQILSTRIFRHEIISTRIFHHEIISTRIIQRLANASQSMHIHAQTPLSRRQFMRKRLSVHATPCATLAQKKVELESSSRGLLSALMPRKRLLFDANSCANASQSMLHLAPRWRKKKVELESS